MKFKPGKMSRSGMSKQKVMLPFRSMQFRREELGGGGIREEYSWWWDQTVSVIVLMVSAIRSSTGDVLRHQEPLIRSSPLLGLFSFLHDNCFITYTWSIRLRFLQRC